MLYQVWQLKLCHAHAGNLLPGCTVHETAAVTCKLRLQMTFTFLDNKKGHVCDATLQSSFLSNFGHNVWLNKYAKFKLTAVLAVFIRHTTA